MEKRLYKSSKDKVLAGVCGGIGEYFGVDPVLIRILWVVSAIFGGVGILAYIIAAIIIPDKSEESGSRQYNRPGPERQNGGRQGASANNGRMPAKDAGLTIGSALIAIGAFFLLKEFMPWISGGLLAAALFIAIGVLLVLKPGDGK